MVHGGNVYETARRLGCRPEDLLDFSASINPLGPPPGLLDTLVSAYHRLQHYPDITNRSLVRALARRLEIPSDRIVVGNGSTELIYLLPRVLGVRRVLTVLPTFSEYVKAFSLQGVDVVRCIASAAHLFQPTVEDLERLWVQSVDAVLVTHPGSPSGTLLPDDVRSRLLEKTRSQGIPLVVDEVFVDFCQEASFLPFLEDHPQLILIRSMTKFYGIPGLRLGYVIASPKTAQSLADALPPWTVNTLAQEAGVYCLAQEEYRRETLELVRRERCRMKAAMESLEGFRVFPGEANYLLVRLSDALPPATVLREALLERDRLLIRDCASFEGLSDRDFRVAVRMPKENDRFLEALSSWCRDLIG